MPTLQTRKREILLVDDHEAVLLGLKVLLRSAPGLEVSGLAKDADEARRRVAADDPDLICLDLALPGTRGLELCRELAAGRAEVVVYTSSEEPDAGMAALQAGACGCVCKQEGIEALSRALLRAAAGRTTLSHIYRSDRPVQAALSERQGEIVCLVARGMSNPEIAGELGIGVETVKTHLREAMKKIGVSDRTEAAVYAVRSGLA